MAAVVGVLGGLLGCRASGAKSPGEGYPARALARTVGWARLGLFELEVQGLGEQAAHPLDVEPGRDTGSVIRKHLGYSHIPGRFAQQVNDFAQGVLSPYLNFHRPCFFPTEGIDAKGRLRKRYPYATMTTPYEKLKSLPEAAQYLKPGVTFKDLDAIAYAISDNEAARRLNEARATLFRSINQAQQPAA